MKECVVVKDVVWFHRYRLRSNRRLNALSSRVEFDGALVRIGDGFACLHPWPELGDPPLGKCLEDLVGARRWPLTRRAVRCAMLDGAGRRQGVSLFEDLEVPVSHATLAGLDAAQVGRAVAAGFDRVKMKAGLELTEEAKFLREMVEEYPMLRWRLDFNEVPDAGEIGGFLSGLPEPVRVRIDFVEDPCPYAESVWRDLQRTTGIRLAVDREAAPHCAAAQVMVVKPAVDEPVLLGEAAANCGQELVVTSYMDHPLGQAFAAWEAARLDQSFPGRVGVCGLRTEHLFAPDAFVEALGQWSPGFVAPADNGLGFDELLEEVPWKRLT